MNVLVLGDAGFIGSEIIDTLIKSHKINSESLNVIGIDQYSSSDERPLRMASGAWKRHIQCDCASTCNNEVYSIIPTKKPDVIINCAAYVGVDNVKENALRVGWNNLSISYHLCNALTLCKRENEDYNPLIIFFSTSEVYGNTLNASVSNHTYELFPETARGSYATSKLAEENLYHSLSNEGFTNTIIMRLFNIVGERQSDRFVISKLMKHIKETKEEVFEVTPTFRKFCYVDFLTDCVERIIYQYIKSGHTTFPKLTNFTSFREENYVSMMSLITLASELINSRIYVKLVEPNPTDIIYRKSESPNIPPAFLDHSKDIPLKEILERCYGTKK